MKNSKTANSVYGYVRVSTKDQNPDRQLAAMEEAGVPKKNIYLDRGSGKDFDRPAYARLLKKLRPGEISLPKWIQSHKSETALKSLEIRHFTAFATSSAALGEGRFSVLCG